MPHTRYTRLVRKSERAQLARQEKKLVALARQLHRGCSDSVELPLVMTAKQRRRTRLEESGRHKPARHADEAEIRAA